MRIDLPLCGLQSCRNYFDGNCKSKNDYEKCECAYDKNRLAELEGKLEQGLMIELPCKVGDTVYWISNFGTRINQGKINTVKISKFGLDLDIFQQGSAVIIKKEFENVFLTESEAQAEIERRNHEKESN